MNYTRRRRTWLAIWRLERRQVRRDGALWLTGGLIIGALIAITCKSVLVEKSPIRGIPQISGNTDNYQTSPELLQPGGIIKGGSK